MKRYDDLCLIDRKYKALADRALADRVLAMVGAQEVAA
jgi:hypothetical protein